MLGFSVRLIAMIGRLAWRLAFVLTFLLFILSQTISGISHAVSRVLSTTFGVETVADRAHRRADAELEKNEKLRHSSAELENKNKRLTADAENLRSENRKIATAAKESLAENRKLQQELTGLRKKAAPDVNWRGKKRPLSEAVTEMSADIGKRTRKAAGANVASMFGEGIPFYGVAIIVVATGYELKTSCDNMRDMREIALQLDPSYDPDGDAEHVCGIKVPTRDQVWTTIKNSPSAAWSMARNGLDGAMDSIPTWENAKSATSSAWGAIKDSAGAAGTWVGDTGSATGDWISESASSSWQYLFEETESTADDAQEEACWWGC